MDQLDKIAIGRRIRQIRVDAGLRQWELAGILGTTQSAVHKYEHGVVPEPRRLIGLARVGGTTIEWILTGVHWENGSAEQRRLPPDLLETALRLREVVAEGDGAVDEAVRILREAAVALRDGTAAETATLLERAVHIQRAVLRRVLRDAHARLSADGEPR